MTPIVGPVKVRKDVWKLPRPWNPTLEWYAKAILELQSRPITDPTSWRYQAAVHDYDPDADPLAKPGEALPPAAEQRTYWRQCQHYSWFFLPWHRMYLACFEQMIAAAVVKLGGPADWALPYWNYSDGSNPDARKLPPAFRDATLNGKGPNPLRIEKRRTVCNAGKDMAMPRDVDLSICLRDPDFPADPVGGSHGFGGPETKFNHDERDGSRRAGDLELQPHNTIHGDVGGATGFMGAFNTAALDPLFWLHHANIDRLWEVWRHRDPAHKNPSGGVWSSLPFDLHDSDGKPIKFVASDVEDTTAPKLKYRYEDVSDPLPAMVRTAAPVRALMAQKPIPEMVGASEKPVSVAGAPATTSVLLSAPTGPARVALAASAPKKAYLNIENVTGTGATTYSVYLNLPAKSDHTKHEDLFAGLLPTFGVREATRRDERHSGSGLHFTLEVTDLIHRLSEQQNWDPKSLSVTFVPKSDEDEPVEIHVGRVSLYYA